ncbi:hypothetical protein pf16_134 [Pseudomonas phage pf16]|uniref:Uncharacterized protein n=1 Tax=Pseudomonas phage pf16 TaxID=1815630 RepID=A0A1S5R3S2_9CAUD|nr:hypothetical protein FDG98_gp164 [Pseudomonas phage pf16]AND75057.1 hypothetical protein pf16_134 [Pseudomonas phage pf16]
MKNFLFKDRYSLLDVVVITVLIRLYTVYIDPYIFPIHQDPLSAVAACLT